MLDLIKCVGFISVGKKVFFGFERSVGKSFFKKKGWNDDQLNLLIVERG